MTESSVVLNRYSGTYDKSDKFSVKVDGQIKCKNMTKEGARAFAAKLGGDMGYVDRTKERSVVIGKLIIDTPEPTSSEEAEDKKEGRFNNAPLSQKKEKKDKKDK